MLKDHFNNIFNMLPSYHAKYGNVLAECGVIKDMKFSADGSYSFVEFWTEELSSESVFLLLNLFIFIRHCPGDEWPGVVGQGHAHRPSHGHG